MKKESAYIAALAVLAVFMVLVFTTPSENLGITGNVVDENATCVEDWSCGDWDTCADELQSRTCTDASACGTLDAKPDESQACVVAVIECVEDWSCGDWDTCANETQSRTCTDASACGTEVNKSEESQVCVAVNETCVEDWSCGDWDTCADELQSRTCTDASACGTLDAKPDESQTCVMPEEDDEEESTVQVTIDKSKSSGGSDVVTNIPSIDETPVIEEEEIIEEPVEVISIFTGQIIEATNETCYGCILNDNCYELDDRKKNQYCIENGVWVNQTEYGEQCTSDFECGSNNCELGEEGTEKTCGNFNVFKSVSHFFDWFKGLFSGFSMASNETNTTEVPEENSEI